MAEQNMIPGEIEPIVHAIRDGDVSAIDVLDRYLRAADLENGQINAFVTRTAERATERAKMIDRDPPRSAPLLGVPFTVKDTIQTKDVRTTAGSLLLSNNVPEVDAPVVARLKAAGAVMVGKTNCPEFAMDINTANRVAGVTRNPLDVSRTSGGSSGGDSAAVAAGFGVFGIGTDYGSSLRWPAHCTGLATLRPTVGRVPAAGLLPNSSPHPAKPANSLSVRGTTHVVGPIARSVADLRTVFSVISGSEPGRPKPDRDIVASLRVAWFDGDGNIPARSDIAAAVASAASRLGDEGALVDFRRPPGFEEAAMTLRALRDAEGLADVERLADGREELLAASTKEWLASSQTVSVAELQDLAARRDALRFDAERFMEDWPIWILPVATIPAFELDVLDPSYAQPEFDVEGMRQARYETMSPCWAVSLYGFPAVVLRVGTSTEGLPIGLQIVGRPNSDERLLEIAAQIEELVRVETWAARYPASDSR